MRWALLLVFATLPLQWFRLPGPGSVRLHIAVLLAVTAYSVIRLRGDAFGPLLRATRLFVALNLALFLVAGTAAFYHGDSPYRFAQQALLVAIFVGVGTLAYRAASGATPGALELLRWSALACGLVLVGGLAYSMAVNGVNAASVLSKTIATADPEFFQHELFRRALAGFGYNTDTVKSNIRHEVFGAVLLSICVSITAVRLRPLTTRAQRALYTFSLILCAVLLLGSLSRAVLLASLALPAFALLSAFRAGGLTRNQLVTIATGAVLLGALAVSGFLTVLWARFTTDTSSYGSRDKLLQGSLTQIQEHWLTGGVQVQRASSHNYVLDYWQRAGIFAALLAVLAMVTVFLGWAVLLRRVGPRDPWAMPLAAAVALPVVRLFTAGGGLMPPVQFVCLAMAAGLALGVLAERRTSATGVAPAAVPPPAALSGAR